MRLFLRFLRLLTPIIEQQTNLQWLLVRDLERQQRELLHWFLKRHSLKTEALLLPFQTIAQQAKPQKKNQRK